jgi:hypothetical protein
MEVRLRDLDIVTEDAVITNFQGGIPVLCFSFSLSW